MLEVKIGSSPGMFGAFLADISPSYDTFSGIYFASILNLLSNIKLE